jgi:hypothetical protein
VTLKVIVTLTEIIEMHQLRGSIMAVLHPVVRLAAISLSIQINSTRAWVVQYQWEDPWWLPRRMEKKREWCGLHVFCLIVTPTLLIYENIVKFFAIY